MIKMRSVPAGLISLLFFFCHIVQAQPCSSLKISEPINFIVTGSDTGTAGYNKNGVSIGVDFPDDFIIEGVRRRDDSQEFVIYPNPVNELLDVGENFKGMVIEAEIRNTTGILIKKALFTGTINISDLLPGYYFISIIKKGHEKHWNGNIIKR